MKIEKCQLFYYLVYLINWGTSLFLHNIVRGGGILIVGYNPIRYIEFLAFHFKI